MNYNIPILTRTPNKARLNNALHLIVVFVLFITGAFVLMYKAVHANLPAAEQSQMAILPVERWQGSLVLCMGLLLLVLVLFKNGVLLNAGISKTLRLAELAILGGFAVFTLIHGIFMPAVLYSAVCLLIIYSFFRDNTAHKVPEVGIDDAGIYMPMGAISKKLDWTEVENVLLRHSVLTIDCADNRFYQWNTVKMPDMNVAGFEEFCRTQIGQAKPHRKNNDW